MICPLVFSEKMPPRRVPMALGVKVYSTVQAEPAVTVAPGTQVPPETKANSWFV